MYCPKCGKAEQTPGAYCRNCGVYLFDASKPAESIHWSGENVNVPTFVGMLRPAVCFISAILLYAVAGSQPGANRIIPITAVILFAMGIVQAQALRKTISLKKRLKIQDLVAHNDAITAGLLVPPNFADLTPDSVTGHTTKQLSKDQMLK
jgi:hypothetical protein